MTSTLELLCQEPRNFPLLHLRGSLNEEYTNRSSVLITEGDAAARAILSPCSTSRSYANLRDDSLPDANAPKKWTKKSVLEKMTFAPSKAG